MLHVTSEKEAIRIFRRARQQRESGRPKGAYGIDPVEAIVIAVSVEYLPQRDILRELQRQTADYSYQSLRRRIDRGNQLIAEGHDVPDELRQLAALPADERVQRCRQALRALKH